MFSMQSPARAGWWLLCAQLLCATVWAQEAAYPSKVVEVIVPYAAGGGVGAMGRVFAAEAAAQTGQQWVVINREGAGGLVGFSALARAKPDGYTVVFSPASPLTNSPFVVAKMPFTAEQIEPVCQVFENVFAIAVAENSPIKTLPELIAKAKAKPGTVSYGHAGPGSVPHLSIAAIEKAARVSFNALAYRGDAPAMQDLMGGTLDFAALGLSSIGGKNFRVLAVLSDQKHPSMPEAPLVTQFGYPAISPGLNGVYVPAGTPRAVVERIEGICKAVTSAAGFKDNAQKLSQLPQYLPAAQFRDRIASTYKTHATLVPDLKLEKQ
jgi:tripartite-type tricarboxylate transporter receptor subunit TctC